MTIAWFQNLIFSKAEKVEQQATNYTVFVKFIGNQDLYRFNRILSLCNHQSIQFTEVYLIFSSS